MEKTVSPLHQLVASLRETYIFIISGPSGAGKGSLLKVIREIWGEYFGMPISVTTRKPRPGEENGKDYYFVSREEFRQMVKRDKFAEWAEVHNNLYGTLRSELDRIKESGKSVLLEINVKGRENLKANLPDGNIVDIFIAPPTIEVLKERIVGRAPISEEELVTRLQTAREEMPHALSYRHVVVNDVQFVSEVLVSAIFNYYLSAREGDVVELASELQRVEEESRKLILC